jgi:hypothetical protein
MGLLTVRSALQGQEGNAAQRARKVLEHSAWAVPLLNPIYLRLHPANEEEADIPSVARTEERTEKRPEQIPMETRSNPNEMLPNFAQIKFTMLRTYFPKIIDRD